MIRGRRLSSQTSYLVRSITNRSFLISAGPVATLLVSLDQPNREGSQSLLTA